MILLVSNLVPPRISTDKMLSLYDKQVKNEIPCRLTIFNSRYISLFFKSMLSIIAKMKAFSIISLLCQVPLSHMEFKTFNKVHYFANIFRQYLFWSFTMSIYFDQDKEIFWKATWFTKYSILFVKQHIDTYSCRIG